MADSKYDITLTDASGESHGFVADWTQGGAGLSIEKATNLSNSSAGSTKGDFGVRDVEDHQRIIQTDWSLGQGQKTYDREVDSESAFDESWCVNIDREGDLSCGPATTLTTDTAQLTAIHAALTGGAPGYYPLIWAGFTHASDALKRVKYTVDGVTWYDITVAGPTASPTAFTDDGSVIYMLADDKVWTVHSGGATTFSASGTNASLTAIAFSAGYLYAAKGNSSTTAQLGYFNSASPPAWTALTPDRGAAINSAGTTFGLASSGSYVYWGITNNRVTKLYKVRYGGGAVADVLEEVAVFPSGFVGTCMTAYLDSVYVGGYWRGSDANLGMGSIYAVVNDTPVLLTDFGDVNADSRILAMTCYGRDLYFAASNDLWRWDLVKGGYSHFTGPIDTSAAKLYSGITWTGDWPMDALPGAEGPTLAILNPLTTGTAVPSVAGGTLTLTLVNDCSITYNAKTNDAGGKTNLIADATGTTAELDLLNADALATKSVALGIRGSTNAVMAQLSAYTTGKRIIELGTGNDRASFGVLHIGFIDDETGTLRLTLKGSEAKVYWNGALVTQATVSLAASPAKSVWFDARQTATRGSGTVRIGAVRWSDDGAYESDSASFVTLTGMGLTAAGGRVYAACSGTGCAVTSADESRISDAYKGTPWLRSSRSSGNMPTVEKYFSALHVTHDPFAYGTTSVVGDGGGVVVSSYQATDLGATFIIDGQRYPLTRDADLSSDTLSVFPIGLTGKHEQWELSLETLSALHTPVVQEVAVLFDPMPKTSRLYSYYLRFWENVECLDGSLYDYDPTVADWLEEVANTVVTVGRPGRPDFQGRIELLKNVEAPPSARGEERAGLYQLQIRRV